MARRGCQILRQAGHGAAHSSGHSTSAEFGQVVRFEWIKTIYIYKPLPEITAVLRHADRDSRLCKLNPPCTRMYHIYTRPFFEATPPGAAPGPPVNTGARVRHFRGCKYNLIWHKASAAGEVGARALRVRSVSREEAWASAGVQGAWVSGCGCEAG